MAPWRGVAAMTAGAAAMVVVMVGPPQSRHSTAVTPGSARSDGNANPANCGWDRSNPRSGRHVGLEPRAPPRRTAEPRMRGGPQPSMTSRHHDSVAAELLQRGAGVKPEALALLRSEPPGQRCADRVPQFLTIDREDQDVPAYRRHGDP